MLKVHETVKSLCNLSLCKVVELPVVSKWYVKYDILNKRVRYVFFFIIMIVKICLFLYVVSKKEYVKKCHRETWARSSHHPISFMIFTYLQSNSTWNSFLNAEESVWLLWRNSAVHRTVGCALNISWSVRNMVLYCS